MRFELGVLFLFSAAAAAAASTQGVRYDLRVQVLPAEHQIAVNGTWSIPRQLWQSTDRKTGVYRLTFWISPKMRDLSFRRLREPAQSARIGPVCVEDGGDKKCHLDLSIAKAEDVVVLDVSYRSDGTAAPQFRVNDDGAFAGGGGELWYPQLSFGIRDRGRLRFTVPKSWVVVSNGRRLHAKNSGAQREFSFAASEPVKFGFAAGEYRHLREGRLNLYLLRERPGAPELLHKTSQVLDVLTASFGAFSHQQFSLVEVDFKSRVLGTSEYGFLLADKSQFDSSFNIAYWAHEMSHQWWGNLVKARGGTPGQMMMTEGMAQFGALLAVDKIEGAAAAEAFRKRGLLTRAQSIEGYRELLQQGRDLPLAVHIPQTQDQVLLMHRLANSKGMMVLWMLKDEIGEEEFLKAVREFLKRHANSESSWADFERSVGDATRRDLTWFFQQWTRQTGLPGLRLQWTQQAGSVEVTVSQCSPPYYLLNAVPLKLHGRNGDAWKNITIAAVGSQQFRFSSPAVTSVELDPQQHLLWTSECHSVAGAPGRGGEAH